MKKVWRILKGVVAPVGLSVGAALVDVGVLDGELYHVVAGVFRALSGL